MILQGINDQFKSYMTTIDLARPFGLINIFAIGLNVVMGWLFITKLQMPILGFPICKFINEVIVSILIVILWCRSVRGEYKTKVLWDQYRIEILGYLWTALKVIGGFYCTFLGFELNTYYAGLTHDNIQIAAYVGWTNLAGIVFCTGLGFGIIGRTKVGTLLGMSKPVDAKNMMWFNITVTGFVGVFVCILFNCIKYYLTLIYTGVPEISNTMQVLIMIYAFCCILEFSNGGLGCYMRCTGNIKLVSFLMFFYIVVVQGTLSYVLCFVCEMGVTGLLASFAASSVLLNGTNLIILSRVDWVEIKGKEKLAEAAEEESEDFDGTGFGYSAADDDCVKKQMEIA
jgi:Na+-driven multidrug efflux pump